MLDATPTWSDAPPTAWDVTVAAQDTCLAGVQYRVAGVLGAMTLVSAWWVASRFGHAARQALRRRPVHPQRLAQSSPTRRPEPEEIDVAPAVARSRRRARRRSVVALAGVPSAALLTPPRALAVVGFLFGLVAVVVVYVRDLLAMGFLQDTREGTPPGRLRTGPPLFLGGPDPVPGLALTWAGLSALGLGWLLAYVSAGSLPCHDTGTGTDGTPLETAAIAAALWVCGVLLLRGARRTAVRSARELLTADDRAPVLLLRSFSDDALDVRTSRAEGRTWLDVLTAPSRERFEQVVAWQLWSYGPVVAIRRPGGPRRPIGAARQELDAGAWTRDIEEWLLSARLIAMTLGRTDGLRWEISRIRALDLRHKLVLLFPPVDRTELAHRWEEFQRIWEPGVEPTALPPPPAQPLTAVMADLGPVVVTGREHDQRHYEAGLRAAVASLDISAAAWDLTPGRRRSAAPAWTRHEQRGGPAPGQQYLVALPDGVVVGPYGLLELQRMAGHHISVDTPVDPGHGHWVPVARVPGVYSQRSRRTALLLAVFGGVLGLDRFYLGKYASGSAKLLTLGGLGSWWAMDVLLLVSRVTVDTDGRPLQ